MTGSRKVVVTGGSGLLGRALILELKATGFEVLGLAFSRAKGDLIRIDLNSNDEVAKLLDSFKPSLLIHAAAQRAPDQFDTNYAASYQLNVEVSRALAKLCTARSIGMIHISTDYVFNGSTPPYSETDLTTPINTYGQSKADAEKAVLEASDGQAVILRVPVLYGEEEFIGESAISGLLSNLLDNSKPRIVSSYEVRRPACTEDIVYICTKLAERKIEDPKSVHGVYQWSGSEMLTKFDMVTIMGQVFQLSTSHIEADPNPGTGAPRPRDVTMSRDHLESLSISRHTQFADGCRKFFAKFVSPQS